MLKTSEIDFWEKMLLISTDSMAQGLHIILDVMNGKLDFGCLWKVLHLKRNGQTLKKKRFNKINTSEVTQV